VAVILWECGHYARFGDFFGYGYHTDLFEDHSDLGAPRLYRTHCLRVANYSFSVLKFEAIQTPKWGITDGAVLFHYGLEKWNDQTHSWMMADDSQIDDPPGFKTENAIESVWPGRSIRPNGCYEATLVKGVQKGDVVRIVAFTLYSKPPDAPGQRAFYSPAFTVRQESAGSSKN
jgi:hypothetical protein